MGCADCIYCVDGLHDKNGNFRTVCVKTPSNDPAGCGYMIIDGIDHIKERMWFCHLKLQMRSDSIMWEDQYQVYRRHGDGEYDLISRDALLAAYDAAHKGPPGGARKLIAEAPAVDATPVRHGRWILEQNGSGVCAVCNRSDHIDRLAKYCRFCGAKMDGDAL